LASKSEVPSTKKPVYAFSSGDGVKFEQVTQKGKNGFALYDPSSRNCTFEEKYGAILPRQNVPWLLPDMPTEYESDFTLYNDVRKYIYDHVELQTDVLYDILAAWTMAAYRLSEFDSFPYINIIGPSDSGKTRLERTLQHLSYRGIFGPSMTASAMFRAIHKDNVTVFYDQCEHLSNSKEASDLLAIIDNGYQKGGKKFLTNTDTGDYEFFNLYSPKVFASTKTLEGTLESRSIRINMQAKTREISIKIDEATGVALRGKLLLYRFRHAEENEDAEVTLMKHTKDGRLIELFLPLYTVTLSPSFPSGSSSPSVKILEYMKNTDKVRQDLEQISIEAQIIKAISECSESVQDGKLSFIDITEFFNSGRLPNEQWGTKGVSKRVKDLGFECCRMKNGRAGIYWDDKLLKKHQERFMKKVERSEETKEQAITVLVGQTVSKTTA
jgi:hypothetical protein